MAISIEDLRDSSISSGTHDSDTLINRFMNVLRVYAQDKYDAYVKENPEVSDYEELDDETKGYIVDELFDLMNDIAPEGTYFGASEGDGADFGFWTVEESCKTEKTYTAPYYLIDGKKANHTDMISLAARMGLDPNQRKYNGVIDMAKAIVAGTHKPKKGALSDKSIALAKEFLSRVKGPFKEESKQGKINEGPGAGYTIKITSFEPNSGRLVAGRGFNRLVVTGHIDWEATGYDWKAVDNEYPVTLSIDLSRTLEEFEDIDGAYDARMQTGSLTDFVNDNMDYIIGRLKFDDDGYSYGGGYTFSCPSDGEFVFGANLVNDGYDNFVVEYDYKARDGFTIDSPDMADEIRWVHDTQSDSGKVESKQSEADYARASKPVADAYKVLDNYYLDNGKLSDFLTEQVLMTYKNDGAMYSRSKSKAVKSHSLAWESLLTTINALLEWDDETEHATKLTSEQVKNWFKANGMDYKEALKPIVDAIENQRKEWFGVKESLDDNSNDILEKFKSYLKDLSLPKMFGEDYIYRDDVDDIYSNELVEDGNILSKSYWTTLYMLESAGYLRPAARPAYEEELKECLDAFKDTYGQDAYNKVLAEDDTTILEQWYEFKDNYFSEQISNNYGASNYGIYGVDFEADIDIDDGVVFFKMNLPCEPSVIDSEYPLTEEGLEKLKSDIERVFTTKYEYNASKKSEGVVIPKVSSDAVHSKSVKTGYYTDNSGLCHIYVDGVEKDIMDFDKAVDAGYNLQESKKSEKLTQKDLKQMATSGAAIDITNVSDEEAKEIRSRKLDTVAISRGTYGMNGALLKDKEGKTYVITARNSNLFYFV